MYHDDPTNEDRICDLIWVLACLVVIVAAIWRACR